MSELRQIDENIQGWIVDHRSGLLDPIFEGLSLAGSFGLIWLALALAVSLVLRRRFLWVPVGVAILLAEASSGALKLAVERDRPPTARPVPEPLLEAPSTFSFPSGHATVSFACATLLAVAVPRLRWAFFGLAALIAFSRVYVGVHYPFDVLAGAVLGVGIATALRMLGAVRRRSAPPMRPG